VSEPLLDVAEATQRIRTLRGVDGDVEELPIAVWDAMREGARQRRPTPDDVWTTRDRRRLDTPEKLIAFLRDYGEQSADGEAVTRGAPTRTAP
jgi:hypothetical protein